MTALLGRLACRLGWHLPPPWVDEAYSIQWACYRCESIQDGALALRRRRP